MAITILNPKMTEPAAAASRAGLCALVVMAKAPRPGSVKTRLSPPLKPEQATLLSVSFLRDTTESLATVAAMPGCAAAGVVAYTPAGDEALFNELLPEGFALLAQRGEGFGERLLAAVEDILACGYGSVCLVDSDSPTVPPAAYRQAVSELARPGDRIVLGAAADGGYYLIGMTQAHATVFEGIEWSTETVAAHTREQARRGGIEVVELPLWYDVDDGASLEILKAELLAGIAPGFVTVPGYGAPRTKAKLMEMEVGIDSAKGLALDAGGAADAAVDEQETPGGFD